MINSLRHIAKPQGKFGKPIELNIKHGGSGAEPIVILYFEENSHNFSQNMYYWGAEKIWG